ncbi:hypothetical protein H072_577 [Dactylellina haptotyla CBS 200.50]|uniref:Ribosomal protein S17 n=1 Tax=Dactylellina haptotyla (strain CBS 200.50) TaxID=1284197 RepID=S8C102_DACHA|nr:hypothetical protein H072_577 [Dactylellina haptotyla CBS 200.50]
MSGVGAIAAAVTAAATAAVKPKVFTRVGIVVSAGMQPKMVKVRVPMPVWNSKLRKYFHHTKDHLAHDENSACLAGDVVRIQPFQRHSKHKKHVVYEVISPFGTGERKAIETPEEREARLKAKRDVKLEKREVRRKIEEEKMLAKKRGKEVQAEESAAPATAEA